jgi:hypothetical protein
LRLSCLDGCSKSDWRRLKTLSQPVEQPAFESGMAILDLLEALGIGALKLQDNAHGYSRRLQPRGD